MSHYTYYIEVAGLDVAGVSTTFYFGTESFVTEPTRSTLPNQFIDGRLLQPFSFKREMFGANQTRGTPSVGNGTITLQNADGALDYLASYGFDAQEILLRRFSADAPTTEVFTWYGFTESVLLTETEVIFTVRDAIYVLDMPLQSAKFGGTNVLPDGLDGLPTDLKGKPMPIWVGNVFNASPPCINTSRLIYMLDYGGRALTPYTYTLTVYDSRVALTLGVTRSETQIKTGSFSDNATMTFGSATIALATAHGWATGEPIHVASTGTMPGPFLTTVYYYARVLSPTTVSLHNSAADANSNTNPIVCTSVGTPVISLGSNRTPYGMYDYYNYVERPGSLTAGFLIRLGSKPIGQVTFDGTYSWNNTPFLWFEDLVSKGRYGVYRALYATSTVGYPPNATIANQSFGMFIDEEANVLELAWKTMASLGASAGCYQPVSPFGLKRCIATRIEPGTVETSLLTLTDADVLAGSFRRLDPGDPERGTPATRCNLQYAKNYTVQTGNQVGAGALDPTFVALPYRTWSRSNSAILAQFPAAPQISVDTFLTDSASADLQAVYYVNSASSSLYSKKRDVYTVKIPLDLVFGLSISLNTEDGTLTLAGINALVMGKPISLALTRVTRTCWLIGYELDLQESTAQLTLWG